MKKVTLREPLAEFIETMEFKLKLNDHKGGWKDCSKEFLISKLKEEVAELIATLELDQKEEITFEAADVANIAMMLADNFGLREESMKKNIEGLQLCSDCFFYHETGEASFLDYHYGDDADLRFEEVEKGLNDLQKEHGNLHYTGKSNEFDTCPCDACGTRLFGYRYEYETYIGEE